MNGLFQHPLKLSRKKKFIKQGQLVKYNFFYFAILSLSPVIHFIPTGQAAKERNKESSSENKARLTTTFKYNKSGRHSFGSTSSAALRNIRIFRLTSKLDGDFTF